MSEFNDISWDEDSSSLFLRYAGYFVPFRTQQMAIITQLLEPRTAPFVVIDLCCGEGLLSATLLETYPTCMVGGLDGSKRMLEQAKKTCDAFAARFWTEEMDLADRSWRNRRTPVSAVVSSLAIHHLGDEEKKTLFADIYQMLEPGGRFIIADLIEPADPQSSALAASYWDEAVKSHSQGAGCDPRAYEIFLARQWNTFRYRVPDDRDRPSLISDQIKWLELAGFRGIDVYWVYAGHAIFGGYK